MRCCLRYPVPGLLLFFGFAVIGCGERPTWIDVVLQCVPILGMWYVVGGHPDTD